MVSLYVLCSCDRCLIEDVSMSECCPTCFTFIILILMIIVAQNRGKCTWTLRSNGGIFSLIVRKASFPLMEKHNDSLSNLQDMHYRITTEEKRDREHFLQLLSRDNTAPGSSYCHNIKYLIFALKCKNCSQENTIPPKNVNIE